MVCGQANARFQGKIAILGGKEYRTLVLVDVEQIPTIFVLLERANVDAGTRRGHVARSYGDPGLSQPVLMGDPGCSSHMRARQYEEPGRDRQVGKHTHHHEVLLF
ncbi:hypothetical protein BIU99_17860 [Plantibacter sp. MMLR14_011]|nr:hypothetical protein BIU99_17860 [Plantibacter sp. MMLR14_011]